MDLFMTRRGIPGHIPDLPLPLYLHSVGRKRFDMDEKEVNPSFKNKFIELTFCESGSGRMFLYNQEFSLSREEMFIYHSREEHRTVSDSDMWNVYFICFDGPFAEAILDQFQYPRRMKFSLGYFLPRFEELINLCSNNSSTAVRRCSELVMDILYNCVVSRTIEEYGRRLCEIVNFIEENLSDPALNVNLLEENFGIHRTTLNRIFRKELKVSPKTYINDLRHSRARSLLVSSDLSIREIALQCGFQSSSVFNFSFRKRARKTPSEYRELMKQLGKEPSIDSKEKMDSLFRL